MCGVVSLVTNWLVRTFSRNVLQVIFRPRFCKMNCQHSYRMFLYTHDRKMYYQPEGAPPHFSQVVRQYLNHKFPSRWIGRGGVHNWPPRSPVLHPLDYHVWGYIKVIVYVHKANTENYSSELSTLQDASITPQCFGMSLVTLVKKCIQADKLNNLCKC